MPPGMLPHFLFISSLAWASTGVWIFVVSTALFMYYKSRLNAKKGSFSIPVLFELQFLSSIAPFIGVWFVLSPPLQGYGQASVTLEGIVGLGGGILVFLIVLALVHTDYVLPEDESRRQPSDMTQRWKLLPQFSE